MTSNYKDVDRNIASAMLVDGMCDGRVITWGGMKGELPRQIAPEYWTNFKYAGAELEFDIVEVELESLIVWLGIAPSNWRDLLGAETQTNDAPATISPSGAAPITASPYRAPSNARGMKLQRFVDVWAEDVFQAKLGATDNLPGRDELLELARAKVSPHVTDDHARKLRKKYASPDAKKGGARFHGKAGKT